METQRSKMGGENEAEGTFGGVEVEKSAKG